MTTTSENVPMVTLADGVLGPKQGEWTYSDYVALTDDGEWYEIVNGVLVMAPSPDGPHQDSVLRFGHYLLIHVEFTGLGKVVIAPSDVVLSPDNVYQPDVFVVLKAHLERVQEKRVVGPPDLVIELASPSTALYDRLTKYDTYARFGIPEYWIAKTATRTIEVLVLEEGKYRSLGVFRGQERLPSRIVPELPVAVDQFFA
ncbi:MAG: Uma2 family endonuclease [Ktedonobacteraceae bacterium]